MEINQRGAEDIREVGEERKRYMERKRKAGEEQKRIALQRQFRLYIPFLGIARPQPQFPHSCVFERFIYSQDQSSYFLQQNKQTHCGNI
jgi:hypothetical protein